jgi:hypothetical protein
MDAQLLVDEVFHWIRVHFAPRRPAWNTKYYNPDHPNFERDIDVQDSPSNRKFRQRFRVPKWYFHQLVSEVRAAGWFPVKTITGRYVIPLELQIAGVLRHLGRDWVSDDVSETAGRVIVAFSILSWLHRQQLLTPENMKVLRL